MPRSNYRWSHWVHLGKPSHQPRARRGACYGDLRKRKLIHETPPLFHADQPLCYRYCAMSAVILWSFLLIGLLDGCTKWGQYRPLDLDLILYSTAWARPLHDGMQVLILCNQLSAGKNLQ